MSSNENIVLSASELIAQSESMKSLKEEYNAMFTQVASILNEMNEGWSDNLANNFVGKISVAQKGFAKIVEMLECGEVVAKETATSFEDINAVMARTVANVYGGLFSDNLMGSWANNLSEMYQDSFGMTHSKEEVEAAKARIELGIHTKQDVLIANSTKIDDSNFNLGTIAGTPITPELIQDAWDRIHTGQWTKQDIMIVNGSGFTIEDTGLAIDRTLLDGLSTLEQGVFGTNYLEGLGNIIDGSESLGNALGEGLIFENSFGRLDEQLSNVSAILSGDFHSDAIDGNLADYISNIEGLQETIASGNYLEAGIQSSIYASSYVSEEIVSGLFGTLEDNLELGKIATDFLGLGEYGEAVDKIQSGIQEITGMDVSEIGDYIGTGIGELYQNIGDGVPNVLDTLQNLGESAISGVENAFEGVGSLLGSFF